MAKVNRIDIMSNNANNDLEEETTICYRPFRKRTTDHSNRLNSVPGRARGRKGSDLVAGSFLSLSLAMAKMGGIDVHDAAIKGNIDDINRAFKSRFYLDRINYPDENGLTLMHHAAIHDHGDVINCLMRYGAVIDISIGNTDETPLHLAAKHNACDAIKALVQNGSILDVVDHTSRTPLHYACNHGCNEAVETILHEADLMKASHTIINAYDTERATPLHLSVLTCSEDVNHKLLHYGANIYRKDVAGNTPLLLAAKRHKTGIMKLLLKFASSHGKHEYVLVPNEFGMTAIHLSVASGCIENIELCLAFGADVECQSSELLTPLHLAALSGYYEVSEVLINNGAKVNTPDSKNRTCLHYAALSNNVELMNLLISNGALIEVIDIDLRTPLMAAASHDCLAALEFLIKNGASTSGQDKDGKTCLHLIAQKECVMTANVILEHSGIDLVNLRDAAGCTPALTAAAAGSIVILGKLVNRFYEFVKRHEDYNGNNILHLAAMNNHRDTVKIIIDHVSFIATNARNFQGQQALHLAAMTGNNRVMHILIKRGAGINSRDNSGWTPLHYAAQYGFETSVKFLISNEATVDTFNEAKKTPLLIACEKGNVEVAKLLLDNNADPSVRNDKGQNCLDIACEYRYSDIGLAIIETKYWEKVMANRAFDCYNPMKRLLERLPLVAEAVMDRSISYTKSKYGKDEWKQVAFNFTYLESSPEDKHLQDVTDKYIALETISSLNRVRLMKHPLITAYVHTKWKAAIRFIYYSKVILDIIYLFGLGFPIALNARDFLDLATKTNTSSSSYSTLVLPGVPYRNIMVFTTVLIMLSTIGYFGIAGRRVFLYFLKQTLYELFIVVAGLLYALPLTKPITFQSTRIGAFVVFCLFINFIFILRNLSGLGLYVSMLIATMTTIIKVSIVFLLFILAFSTAFMMILSDMTVFKQFDATLATVLTMTAGELNYASTFNHLNSTGRLTGFKVELLFFGAMVVLINIAFANLLIGLAVGDINEVKETANLNRAKNHFQLIIGAYESYPLYVRKIMHSPGLTIREDKNSSFLQRQTWHLLTENLTMIHYDKDEVNQEFDYKDLKASVSKQQTEISRLKELIEDTKSDISITSHANHIETKKLFERILHAVEANGNGKVTTTNVTTNTIFNEAMH